MFADEPAPSKKFSVNDETLGVKIGTNNERIFMKHAVCAVFDKKTATYDNIFNIRHPGEAIRQWDTLRKNPETKFGKNPEDFDLMQIAWYDDSTGTIEQILPHTHLASGV